MVRITFKNNDGVLGANGISMAFIPKPLRTAIYKLKAYEDTGISPEEVVKIKKENEELKAELHNAAV